MTSYAKLRAVLVVALTTGLFAGCSSDSSVAPLENSSPVLQSNDLTDAIVAMGFDRQSIVDRGDHFVVEGDVLIDKSSLEGPSEPTGLTPGKARYQYSTTYVPDLRTWQQYNYAPQIGVDLSAVEAESPAWAAAVRGAIANWHSIPGAQVTFVEATQYTGATYTLTVVRGSCGSDPNTIACARFPTQQCDWLSCHAVPGTQITITRTYDTLPESEKLFAITHEMGHTIGLRHTNWNNRLCGQYPNWYACSEGEQPDGAVHIPGTPTSTLGGTQGDPYSVMNATVLPWSGFTLYDRIAARYLFPGGPGPTPTLGGSETPQISWQPMQDAVAYEVWYVQPQGCGSVICFGPNPPDVETYVATTSATAYSDASRTRTQVCTAPDYFTPVAAYRIKAVFPDNGVKSDLSGYTSCW